MKLGWTRLLLGGLMLGGMRIAVCAPPPPPPPKNCTVSATSVSFGTYSGKISKVTGTISVNCPKGVRYTVSLNQGLAPGATVYSRSMTGGPTNVLGYGLYTDAARTVIWGNTSSNWVTRTGNGAAQNIYVYGEIPANEFSNAATYHDTVTITVQATGANTKPAQLPVSGTVPTYCLISATPLNFGTYTGTVTDATASIDVTCSNNLPYTVALERGASAGATVTKRAMTGPGGALLHYGLFSDSAHTVNWGNTAANHWVSGTGTGTQKSLTVYGEIPAGEIAPAGSYSDTVIARITY